MGFSFLLVLALRYCPLVLPSGTVDTDDMCH